MTDGRTGRVTGHGEDEGHETIPCPFFSLEGQRRERTRSPTPNAAFGVCFMPSQKGAIRPFFLAAGLYFLEGALAEHAEDCSVLREQRREEEKPATRESLVCPYVAVFFQKGSKIS